MFKLKLKDFNWRRVDFIIGLSFIILITSYYSFYSIKANLNCVEGKHVLFMDEVLVFDGARKILNSNSIKNLQWNTMEGSDHRYGRILWISTALFSAIPEYYFGAAGLIITERLLHFIILIIAYFILCFTFIRSWSLRALLFFVLLCIPTSIYFSTLPRPMPLQMLFIALFLWQEKKHNFELGWHWIFLGMAFGTKISVFFLIIYFGIIAFIRVNYRIFTVKYLKMITKTIAFFVLGFAFTEVYLVSYTFFKLNLGPLKNYLRWTFFNTRHPADNSAVNWKTWTSYIFNKYTAIPEKLLAITAILIVVLVTISLVRIIKKRFYSGNEKVLLYNNFAIIWAGVVLILTVMFCVKRIWPHYVHLGMVLFITGIIASAEANIKLKGKNDIISNIARWISIGILILMLGESIRYLAPVVKNGFITLSKRTQSEQYKNKLLEYNTLKDLFFNISQQLDRKISVMYDSGLPIMGSNKNFIIERYWSPGFLYWDRKRDLVVYYSVHTLEGELPAKTSAAYESVKQEKELFRKYVCYDPTSKRQGLYYVPLEIELTNVKVYIRGDLEEKICK